MEIPSLRRFNDDSITHHDDPPALQLKTPVSPEIHISNSFFEPEPSQEAPSNDVTHTTNWKWVKIPPCQHKRNKIEMGGNQSTSSQWKKRYSMCYNRIKTGPWQGPCDVVQRPRILQNQAWPIRKRGRRNTCVHLWKLENGRMFN